MKRIWIEGLTAVQIATIHTSVAGLADWRVGWSPYRQKPFITIPELHGGASMLLGRLPAELYDRVLEAVQSAGVFQSQISISDE